MASTDTTQTDTQTQTHGTVTLTAGELKRALARVKNAAASKSAVAALAGVRIRRGDLGAVIEASDHEMSARLNLAGDVTGSPDMLVPFRHLSQMAKLYAKTDSVTFSHIGDVCEVAGPHTIHRLTLLKLEDFPVIDWRESADVVCQADANELASLTARVASIASTDNTRPVLQAAHLRADRAGTWIESTDSYRLFFAELPGVLNPSEIASTAPVCPLVGDMGGLKVMATSLALACKGGKRTEFAVISRIDGTPGGAYVERAGEIWRLRSIDGQYPSIPQLCPESHVTSLAATVDRLALLELMKGAASTVKSGQGRNTPVRLRFRRRGEKLVASLSVSFMVEMFAADFEILGYSSPAQNLAVTVDGPGLEIGVNAAFFAECLAALDCDRVELRFLSPLRPMMLVDAEGDVKDAALIMPVRLNS